VTITQWEVQEGGRVGEFWEMFEKEMKARAEGRFGEKQRGRACGCVCVCVCERVCSCACMYRCISIQVGAKE